MIEVPKIAPIQLPRSIETPQVSLQPLMSLLSLQERAVDNQRAEEALKLRYLNLGTGITEKLTGISVLPGEDEKQLEYLKQKHGVNNISSDLSTQEGITNATRIATNFYSDPSLQKLISRKKRYDLVLEDIGKYKTLLKGNATTAIRDFNDKVNSIDPNAIYDFNLQDYIYEDFTEPIKDYIKAKTKEKPRATEDGFYEYNEKYAVEDDQVKEYLIESISKNPIQAKIQGLLKEDGSLDDVKLDALIKSKRPPLETSYSPMSDERMKSLGIVKSDKKGSVDDDWRYYQEDVFRDEGEPTEGTREKVELMMYAKDLIGMSKGSKEENEIKQIVISKQGDYEEAKAGIDAYAEEVKENKRKADVIKNTGPFESDLFKEVKVGPKDERTDRHLNPTAFTTDIAEQAGLQEGVDYEKGDPFPKEEGGDRFHTAKLLKDPIDTTIKVIDKIGLLSDLGSPRWKSKGISDTEWGKWEKEWPNMSKEQKIEVIKKMYSGEGGTKLNQLFKTDVPQNSDSLRLAKKYDFIRVIPD